MDILLLYGPGPFLALMAMAVVVFGCFAAGHMTYEWIVCRLDRRRFKREYPDLDPRDFGF